MSQHSPERRQLEALRRLFGDDVSVEQDPRPFDSAEKIADRFRAEGYDDIVVVAPLSVIGRLVDLNLRPLWSQMDQVDPKTGNPDIVYRGRGYRFNRFRRVKALHLEFEELPPH